MAKGYNYDIFTEALSVGLPELIITSAQTSTLNLGQMWVLRLVSVVISIQIASVVFESMCLF